MAIVGPRGRRQTLVAVSSRAHAAGARVGQTPAEALAIAPGLVVLPEDVEADFAMLTRLAEWATRFSPVVGLESSPAPAALLLDVTGGTDCFGGEDRLLERAGHEFAAAGWQVRLALADTVGAAWALAHAAPAPVVRVPPGEGRAALGPLPLSALRLSAETLAHLAELGIGRVEQLLALPRKELPERFGPSVLLRLDQALGEVPEPVVPHRAVPGVSVRGFFDHPTERQAVLMHALERLLPRLEQKLLARGTGARRVEAVLYPEVGSPCECVVELFRPLRCARRLGKLLGLRLETIDLPAPVVGWTLNVTWEEPLTPEQLDLFEDDQRQRQRELATLIDSLTTRWGRDAVAVARPLPDPQPEMAWVFQPALAAGTLAAPAPAAACGGSRALPRPLHLWPKPVPIQVLAALPSGTPHRVRSARGDYPITRAWGPERIATGWWRGADIHRDYFVVETACGSRLWIFRQGQEDRWFWHGCFD